MVSMCAAIFMLRTPVQQDPAGDSPDALPRVTAQYLHTGVSNSGKMHSEYQRQGYIPTLLGHVLPDHDRSTA